MSLGFGLQSRRKKVGGGGWGTQDLAGLLHTETPSQGERADGGAVEKRSSDGHEDTPEA